MPKLNPDRQADTCNGAEVGRKLNTAPEAAESGCGTATTESKRRPTLARVTADGVELAWPLVELFGHGRLRRLLTSFARSSGRPLPDGLGQLVDVIDGAARARSAVGSDGRSCWVDAHSAHDQLRHAPSVSVAEAAELLGIGDEGVRQRIRRHRLDAWRDDDGRWRIPRTELPNHDEQQA